MTQRKVKYKTSQLHRLGSNLEPPFWAYQWGQSDKNWHGVSPGDKWNTSNIPDTLAGGAAVLWNTEGDLKQILISFCYVLTTTDGINTTVFFNSFYFRNIIQFSQLNLEFYLRRLTGTQRIKIASPQLIDEDKWTMPKSSSYLITSAKGGNSGKLLSFSKNAVF